MKKILLIFFTCLIFISAFAQNNTESISRTTLYKDFQPVSILLSNGKSISEKWANIFLRNGSLLYKRKNVTMQADMSMIKSVTFSDRTYICVDTLLAYIVDTLHTSKLLCANLIDMEAYKSNLLNSRQITNYELGYHVNINSIGDSEEDMVYPVIKHFFYEIDGKIVKAHERAILKVLSKDKQRLLKAAVQSPGFSWSDASCLVDLLKLFPVTVRAN